MNRDEQRALTDYFLHAKCGYQYGNGRIGNLTVQEVKRLFTGFKLWNKHVENGDGEKKAGQRATAGDHRAFDEFADKVNSKHNHGSYS